MISAHELSASVKSCHDICVLLGSVAWDPTRNTAERERYVWTINSRLLSDVNPQSRPFIKDLDLQLTFKHITATELYQLCHD